MIQPFAAGQLATVTNAGLIDLTNGASGPIDRLTITGNNIGQGGRLALNTFLGNDASPSDRLVIDRGAASGSTAIRILNAGGPGDLTTANGILVVDAVNGATTVPGTFVLAGPVVAGPYEYSLFRSSVDASNPQAWFLRSELDCRLDPTAAVCRKPGPDPDIREEVSLYAAIPALALLYGRTLLDTLHERVGEEEHLRARGGASPSPYNNGTWGRVIGQHGDRDGDSNGVLGSGPKFDFDFLALQVGQDIYRAQGPRGWRTHAGAYGAIGTAPLATVRRARWLAGRKNAQVLPLLSPEARAANRRGGVPSTRLNMLVNAAGLP